MSFCEGVTVCPRCGGMHVSASTQVSRDLREQPRQTQPLMEAFQSLSHLLSAPNQSMRNTADDMRASLRTQRTAVSDMRRPLEDLAEVRRIIESSHRTPENNQQLIDYVIKKCQNAEIRESLRESSQSLVILPLVDMYKFLVQELEKKKKRERREHTDIIFVAHGGIDSFMFSANYLMPLTSIRDVVLYSPWNCAINADVAYGVATGSIQPHHRVFFRIPQQGCPVPVHPPAKLPNDWNSMSEAGGSRIPRIRLSPFKEPLDPAWNDFVFLQDRFGEPGRNRVLVPFTRQGWMGSFDKIPFEIVTLVLSVVLEVYGYSATVHLAACLSRSEDLDEAELQRQYEYTMDNTMMGSSEERNINDALYRAFKDMFG